MDLIWQNKITTKCFLTLIKLLIENRLYTAAKCCMPWKKFAICGFYLPVIVHNSRRHSSRLLMTAKVLCSSSGASKNGNMAAPINEYSTTNTHSPGVENKIRNVKCTHRFVWITFTVSSLSTTISPSLFSICDGSFTLTHSLNITTPRHLLLMHPPSSPSSSTFYFFFYSSLRFYLTNANAYNFFF